MEFAVWVFKHADNAHLAPAASAILEGCLSLLDHRELVACPHASVAAGQRALQPLPMHAAQPALRAKTLSASCCAASPTKRWASLRSGSRMRFRGALTLPAGARTHRFACHHRRRTNATSPLSARAARCRFFSALALEPAGVRATAQEAVNALSTAFRGCTSETAAAVQALLLSAVEAREEPVRMAALQVRDCAWGLAVCAGMAPRGHAAHADGAPPARSGPSSSSPLTTCLPASSACWPLLTLDCQYPRQHARVCSRANSLRLLAACRCLPIRPLPRCWLSSRRNAQCCSEPPQTPPHSSRCQLKHSLPQCAFWRPAGAASTASALHLQP